jgi:uncharacterized RDD family membrane protein YckC/phage FluMu protein Com
MQLRLSVTFRVSVRMAIEFSCTACGKSLRTSDETAGKKAKCPECGAVMQIPYAAAFAPLPDFSAQASTQTRAQRPSGATPVSSENFNPYQSPSVTGATPLIHARVDTYRLSTRGTRLIGRMIDNLIYVAALIPGFIVIGMLPDDRPPGRGGNDELTFAEAVGVLVMLGGPLVVEIINSVLVVRSGQTLAKKMLGMRIVRLDDSLPGFVNGVILRSWVPAFIGLFFGGLFYMANALAVFGQERRCIHDLLAGTRVVDG